MVVCCCPHSPHPTHTHTYTPPPLLLLLLPAASCALTTTAAGSTTAWAWPTPAPSWPSWPPTWGCACMEACWRRRWGGGGGGMAEGWWTCNKEVCCRCCKPGVSTACKCFKCVRFTWLVGDGTLLHQRVTMRGGAGRHPTVHALLVGPPAGDAGGAGQAWRSGCVGEAPHHRPPRAPVHPALEVSERGGGCSTASTYWNL